MSNRALTMTLVGWLCEGVTSTSGVFDSHALLSAEVDAATVLTQLQQADHRAFDWLHVYATDWLCHLGKLFHSCLA